MEATLLKAMSATKTHTGHKRQVNEDAVFGNAEKGIWAVADGMGGYAAGDVASATVINALAQVELNGSLDQNVAAIKSAIQLANKHLLYETTLPAQCQQLGTTVVALCYTPGQNRCACLWVGDSRVYVLRDHALYQLTKDHSVVQEMVDNGVLAPELRDSHPQSHVITRAIGVADELDIDVVTFMPQAGDIYLLCSDGLYNDICLHQELTRIYQKVSNSPADDSLCETLACGLMDAVLSTEASDNITVSVITLD